MRELDVATFDTGASRRLVQRMAARNEDVHDVGVRHREKTGKLPPNVDIVGKPPRGSHNALTRGEGGTAVLTNGISWPHATVFDATGSTYHLIKDFFYATQRLWGMFDGLRTRYNPQLATGIVTDRFYLDRGRSGLPPLEFSQFEGDNRSEEQVRELVHPNGESNDTAAEDYELALFYSTLVYTDISAFYGLKGHMTLILDEVGRGSINGNDISRYLGQNLDSGTLSTGDIWKNLLERWWPFILQIPSWGGSFLPKTKPWWEDQIGSGWIIQVEDPRLLSDVIAGLAYVTETMKPSQDGLAVFMQGGGDGPEKVKVDLRKLNQVWRMLQQVEEHFSVQALLPGYHDIPLPGDIFAHYRHAWPIGHSRADENVTPLDVEAS